METLEPLDLLEKLENDIEFQALGKKYNRTMELIVNVI